MGFQDGSKFRLSGRRGVDLPGYWAEEAFNLLTLLAGSSILILSGVLSSHSVLVLTAVIPFAYGSSKLHKRFSIIAHEGHS